MDHNGRIQRFELPWPPSANKYWRNIPARGKQRAKVLISSDGRRYRRHIAGLLLEVGYKPLGAARIGIYIEARPPDNRKRDLDNLNKAMLDALQKANLYDDDSQIDDLQLVRGPVIHGGQIQLQIWHASCKPGFCHHIPECQ